MTQEQILKAITTSSGGQLSAENAKKFINTTVDQTPFLKKISTVQMTASTRNIDTLGVQSRQIRGAAQGSTPTKISTADFARRTLETKTGKLPYDVSFEFLEENIEEKDADATLQTVFATQFGNDLLDMACNGDESLAATITDAGENGLDDTTGLTQDDHTFLRINNGWRKLFKAEDSGVHLVDLKALTTWKARFAAVLAALPAKWKKDLNKLSWIMNPNDYEEYKQEIGGTAADLGIKILTESTDIKALGIAVEAVAFWPEGELALTDPKNLYVGIGRDMRVGKFANERAGQLEYTITSKFDFEFAVGDAIAYGYDFPAAG